MSGYGVPSNYNRYGGIVTTSVGNGGLRSSRHEKQRAHWSVEGDCLFVSILAQHTVCNEEEGLIINHKYVDPAIIEDVGRSLARRVPVDDLVQELSIKYPNKREDGRSPESVNLIVELKSRMPAFSYQQLNHKHINMWTRSISPFRLLYQTGALFRGKSVFHKDYKRFVKVIMVFNAHVIINGIRAVDPDVFVRKAGKGSKLLEQWLTAMLKIHKQRMANFLYKCGIKLASSYIASKPVAERTPEEHAFLKATTFYPKAVQAVLKDYMDQIVNMESSDAPDMQMDFAAYLTPTPAPSSTNSDTVDVTDAYADDPTPETDHTAKKQPQESPQPQQSKQSQPPQPPQQFRPLRPLRPSQQPQEPYQPPQPQQQPQQPYQQHPQHPQLLQRSPVHHEARDPRHLSVTYGAHAHPPVYEAHPERRYVHGPHDAQGAYYAPSMQNVPGTYPGRLQPAAPHDHRYAQPGAAPHYRQQSGTPLSNHHHRGHPLQPRLPARHHPYHHQQRNVSAPQQVSAIREHLSHRHPGTPHEASPQDGARPVLPRLALLDERRGPADAGPGFAGHGPPPPRLPAPTSLAAALGAAATVPTSGGGTGRGPGYQKQPGLLPGHWHAQPDEARSASAPHSPQRPDNALPPSSSLEGPASSHSITSILAPAGPVAANRPREETLAE
ncbi:hypothetical protein H4R18_003693 [Coemansia javaensis]|uniref:Uncharacterized protein n=1 Tax=Coemansia javaensis TaxID=2761396 RepID=A0A9W8HB81_9FUNG|nr:hypothetical protein H4R18_003693 [Coemansia javaensis]